MAKSKTRPREETAKKVVWDTSNLESLLSKPAATTFTLLDTPLLDPPSLGLHPLAKPVPQMKSRRPRDRLSQTSHDQSRSGRGGRLSQSSHNRSSRRDGGINQSTDANVKAPFPLEDDTIDDSVKFEPCSSEENLPQEKIDDTELTAPSTYFPEQTSDAREQAPTPSQEKHVGDAERKSYDDADIHHELLSQSVPAKAGPPLDPPPLAFSGLPLEVHSKHTARRHTSNLEVLLSRPITTFSVFDTSALDPPSACGGPVSRAKPVPQVKPGKMQTKLADLPTPDTNNKEPVGSGDTSALDSVASMPDMFLKTTNSSKRKNKVRHLVGGLLNLSGPDSKYRFEPPMDSSTNLDVLGISWGDVVAHQAMLARKSDKRKRDTDDVNDLRERQAEELKEIREREAEELKEIREREAEDYLDIVDFIGGGWTS